MPTRMAICLYEENMDRLDPTNLLGGQPLKKINLRNPDPDSLIFLKPSHSGTPEWTHIVDGFADLGGQDTSTASSGAILFFKINKRIIACCFGTSVANINSDNIVPDFGLAVAYHRIPKGKYKKIETFAMTENPITNARSAAMPSSQSTFNLDTYLETITELGGKFLLNMRSVVINGKEFFSIPSPLKASNQSDRYFRDNLTIDIYDNTGKYIQSIYIPNYKGDKAKDFTISSDMILYSVYERNIITYDLSTLINNAN